MSHPCCICPKPAVGPYGGKNYCIEHRPSIGPYVKVDDVARARIALADGHSLSETAQALGVMSADLDRALWNNFGRSIEPRRYQPDFVA